MEPGATQECRQQIHFATSVQQLLDEGVTLLCALEQDRYHGIMDVSGLPGCQSVHDLHFHVEAFAVELVLAGPVEVDLICDVFNALFPISGYSDVAEVFDIEYNLACRFTLPWEHVHRLEVEI